MSTPKMIKNQYQILELLGQGGMGDVYKARNLVNDQFVAVKSLKPEFINNDQNFVERFKREGEMLAQLNHPNIVKMLDAFEEDGRHYIVMEYVSGGSLDDLLFNIQGVLPLNRTLQIALDLCDVLTRAHRLKIIHRDIKPANVLLAEDGTPRLTDFGIARMGESSGTTRTGTIVGTVNYLSPEAANGDKLDARADIWSFGVMLFEMLTGQLPFDEGRDTATLIAIMMNPIPDIKALRPDLPPALVNLLSKMLEKDLNERLNSVRQVGSTLETIMAQVETGIPEVTPASALISPPKSRFEISSTDAGAKKKLPTSPTVIAPEEKTKRLYWIGGAIAAILVVVLGVAYFALGNKSDDTKNSATATASSIVVEPVAPDKNMILVAQLEPLASQPRDVNRFIVSDLREIIEQESQQADGVIREYPAIITSEEEAEQVAKANNAKVIIWGHYTDDSIEVEIQIANLTTELFSEKTKAETANARLQLTNERQQSLGTYVLAALALYNTFEGNTYHAAAAMVLIERLNVENAEVMGSTVGSHVYRYYASFFQDEDTALTEISEGLSVDASNAVLYHLRGVLRQRNGDFAGSSQDFQSALRLSSGGNSVILAAAANNGILTGNLDDALEFFNAAVEQNPTDWFPLTLRGALYYLRGENELAKKDYEQAIAAAPEDNFPYVFSSIIALREGRIVDVMDTMAIVINRFPDPEFANRLIMIMSGGTESGNNISGNSISAFTNMILGQYAQAIENADTGLQVDENLVDFYLIKGLAYCNLDQLAEAEAAYTAGIEHDPEFMLLYLLRAEVRSKQQNLAGALEDTQIAQASPIWAEIQPLREAGGDQGCKSFFTARP